MSGGPPAAKKRGVRVDGVPQQVPVTAAGEVLAPFKSQEEQGTFFAETKKLLSKATEGIEVWDELLQQGAGEFFSLLTGIDLIAASPSVSESMLRLLICAFQSLEKEKVRDHFLGRVSYPLYLSLSPKRRHLETELFPKLRKPLAKLEKKVREDGDHMKEERLFVPKLVRAFLANLAKVDAALKTALLGGAGAGSAAETAERHINVCCRYLELFVDLLSQMPTRRFVQAYIDDSHIYVHCKRSLLAKEYEGESGVLFRGLLQMLHDALLFPVDNQTGKELSMRESEQQYCAKVTGFQRVAYKFYKEKLQDVSMSHLSLVEDKKQLEKYLATLGDKQLEDLCERLCVYDGARVGQGEGVSRDHLLDVLALRHSRHPDYSDLTSVALYPDEHMMWRSGMIPTEEYCAAQPLALPKLNLQFLSLQDYLLRNFKLMQLESTYEIREDIELHMPRMRPRALEDGTVQCTGRSRMLLPVLSTQVTRVAKPHIGYTRPAEVRAEVNLSLADAGAPNVCREWSELRQHDVLMLIALQPPQPQATGFLEKHGVRAVRGCEVIDMRDDEGNVTTGYDMMGKGVTLTGNNRHIRVHLDPVTYHKDVHSGNEDLYGSFNLVMRRRPEENNFKAVLETIRSLMKFPNVIPEWLHELFLGYGAPDSAHYTNIEAESDDEDMDYGDAQDVKEREVIVPSAKASRSRFLYEADKPKPRHINFSAKQSEAIRSANHTGLTLVVGPPGTGKTDVAVQIVSNLYHKYPTQTTLIITHSNAALNDIFTKVMLKDIDQRHLLRLGMGEKELQTEEDFSRWGRVNYMLERRKHLLERVAKLCRVLGVDEGFAHTCESSGHFFNHHVKTRWEKFQAELPKEGDDRRAPRWVVVNFPFADYFDDTLTPFWEPATSFEGAMQCVEYAWDHVQEVFDEVKDCRAFELLRTSSDRGTYLLTKQARIIAMTCTHAALKRRDFLRLGFKYDNLVMEESAQILEIETFIPMALQQPLENGESRLKRIVLIGDHNQLPPVIKNSTFQKYCHMEQSMFTRFVRLGVPVVQLDAQGRMRESLADLFRWRYDSLTDLPHVKTQPEFSLANPGLTFTCQCINVDGQETVPQPHFYQNIMEAEYVVHLYMYMRLLGYDSRKITILTTYNGQKHLIKDVLNHRCKSGSVYGAHPRISTVDKYQGQQNDYILVSLVRTQRVGHFRDIRRLVVALSRARLGLFVFGNVALFRPVWELKEAFDRLLKNPTMLCLNTDEVTSTTTRAANDPGETTVKVKDFTALAKLVSKLESVANARAQTQHHTQEEEDPEAVAWEMRRSREFSESHIWRGVRKGFYFGSGEFGVGYYLDKWATPHSASLRGEEGALPQEQQKPQRAINPAEEARRRALEKVKQARLAAAQDDSDED